MVWNEPDKLTEGQKRAAEFAGIPADRPGLGAEYPKAVYFKDEEGGDRVLNGVRQLVQGEYAVRTSTVNNAEEEADALSQGWYTSPDLQEEQRKADALAEKDAEIAELQRMLAERDAPRRGRPPLNREAEPSDL